jgi:hypothetical protein
MEIGSLSINSKVLKIERQQLIDEGKDLKSVEAELEKLSAEVNQTEGEKFLDKSINLPEQPNYPYHEPSDLKSIRQARPPGPREFNFQLSEEDLSDHILGAWLGRCSGCLLGKPVEGWKSRRMWGYLKETGNYPLQEYFRSDVSPEIIQKYNITSGRGFINEVSHLIRDDDLNYTVVGLRIIKEYGLNFTSENIANFWLKNLPLLHTCTAERVAYRNFALLISPPLSAVFRNPYREWIGAQIRADFWGYISLGYPQQAAEFAWRDARISHIKNGIYGEMWVAAMIASAPFVKEILELLKVGLSEIPQRSRLAEAVKEVISWWEEGINYEEAIKRIHTKWDEEFSYHWCHTLSNAQIVALGLLWSENCFEKGITRAVQSCFDTDCNGATVGSIMGMKLGAKRLPQKWIEPLNDTLETGVAGYNLVRISELAKETLQLYKKLRG